MTSTFIPPTANATTNPTVFGFYVGGAWDRNLQLDNQTVLNFAGLPLSLLVRKEFTLEPDGTELFDFMVYNDNDEDEFGYLCYLGAQQLNWQPSAEFDTQREAVAFCNGMASIRWDTGASRYFEEEGPCSNLVYWDTNNTMSKQTFVKFLREAFESYLDNEGDEDFDAEEWQ
jgi:hypothetical protein